MFWSIKIWLDIKWKEFRVNCIKLELIMFVKLLCLDDKRYILNDNISSLTYFHKDIRRK